MLWQAGLSSHVVNQAIAAKAIPQRKLFTTNIRVKDSHNTICFTRLTWRLAVPTAANWHPPLAWSRNWRQSGDWICTVDKDMFYHKIKQSVLGSGWRILHETSDYLLEQLILLKRKMYSKQWSRMWWNTSKTKVRGKSTGCSNVKSGNVGCIGLQHIDQNERPGLNCRDLESTRTEVKQMANRQAPCHAKRGNIAFYNCYAYICCSSW